MLDKTVDNICVLHKNTVSHNVNMSALRKLACLILLPTLSIGLFVERDRCDVEVRPTEIREPSIREYVVPPDCINGTFRWDYPRKTVELHFTNLYHNQMSVCVRNGMLGNIFTVRDVTHTFGMPMIIGEKESCTPKYRETITLRVDAPETLYYVGSFVYHVYEE